MKPNIKLENLSIVYNHGKTNEFWAVRDINLEIYPEEYVIFFGPSGCGKSTLLYAIAGLEKPSQGRVLVNDIDLGLAGERELIKYRQFLVGIIFQAYYLISDLTAEDNILLPQIFAGKSFLERKKQANFLMERFGVLDFKNKKPSQLSGGQQQRVAIARSLINNPSILLADEPVGNLDSKNAEVVIDLLDNFNKKDKKTIVYVTHDQRHLDKADRVFYMKDGRITREIRNSNKAREGDLSIQNIPEIEKLAQVYPHLSNIQLQAKLILNYIISLYGIDDKKKIEKIISEYIANKIDKSELLSILDRPTEKGGINLYKQTADDMANKIAILTKKLEIMEERICPELTPVEEKAMIIRGYLLDGYGGNISLEQSERMKAFLIQRIIGKLDSNGLIKAFDLPFSDGGVGLNKRTAERFIKEVELMLMKNNQANEVN